MGLLSPAPGAVRIPDRRRDDAPSERPVRPGGSGAGPAAPRGMIDRSPSLQRRYFEEYAAALRAEHPDWSPERVHTAASRYVSPPAIAPHSAGAAVDLTLADADGRELDLGTRMNASPEESGGACHTDAPGITAAARARRGILGAALSAAGLVNYPTEWWHWSYGDRYWALATGAASAPYGPHGAA
ncbi:M15 family metallopeptidase [Streptomyces lavendulae]